MSELEKAFLKAQKNIEHAVKDSTNPFFKSKYVTYDSLVHAVKKPLNDAGLSFRHTSRFSDNIYFVGSLLIHAESGEKSEVFEMPTRVGNAQETGSALSYSRRYTLGAICGVPSSDDDDGNAAATKPTAKTTEKPKEEIYLATNKQKAELMKIAVELGLPQDESLRDVSDYCLNKPMAKLKDNVLKYQTESI